MQQNYQNDATHANMLVEEALIRLIVQTIMGVDGEYKVTFDNKDVLHILRRESQYVGYRPGMEIIVRYGEYAESMNGYTACGQERYSIENAIAAATAFVKRLKHAAAIESGMGQTYDDIFEKA